MSIVLPGHTYCSKSAGWFISASKNPNLVTTFQKTEIVESKDKINPSLYFL